MAAPCECPQARAWVDFWKSRIADLDFSPVFPLAASTGYPVALEPEHLLAPGLPIDSEEPSSWSGRALKGACVWTMERSGTLHGLGGWFVAELAPGIELTNAPGAPTRIRRRNVFLPVEPIVVAEGDSVRGTVTILPSSGVVDWSVSAFDAHGTLRSRSRGSTFEGMLVSAEDLARTAPDSKPQLSRPGQARRLILDLCDGTRRVAEIERRVAEEFADLFPHASDSSRFVAEVLVPYGR
jgi:hypothetical protein